MTNTIPKISVLMPAYNSEKYIAEAIQSILDQTFTDFEFIIINDGSTDTTAQIIKSFKDPRIIFIDNEKNTGLIAVLNHGMDLARGEYIARMDSDDVSFLERFEKQIEFMDKNPDVGVSSAQFHLLDDEDYIFKQPLKVGVLELYDGCKICHPLAMLRKSVFDRYNLRYSPDFIACEDYELWSRVIRYTKIANLPQILLSYRCHDRKISVLQKELQLKNTNRVKKNIADFLTGDEDLEKLKLVSNNKQKYWIKLFWFIPFIQIRRWEKKVRYNLFGILPILKIENKKIKLFMFIPIIKLESQNEIQTIIRENKKRGRQGKNYLI